MVAVDVEMSCMWLFLDGVVGVVFRNIVLSIFKNFLSQG